MPNRTFLAIAVGVMFTLTLAGCGDWGESLSSRRSAGAGSERTLPPYVEGTVGEYARFASGGDLPVRGFGVVVALGTKGSSEVPPRMRKYLVQYLSKVGLGSARHGTDVLPPDRFLSDLDTAVVEVYGVIPPAAPVGTRFDLVVRTVPQTQTESLVGGILMPTDLAVHRGPATEPGSQLNLWAEGRGSLFVNPFVSADFEDADQARLRIARVPGGGKVTQPRPIMLQLREPDYQRADLIQKRITQRFGAEHKPANAKNASVVELKVPPRYRDDYNHYLDLVLHLPLSGGPGAWEAKAREVAEAMNQPTADHEQLALVWEAMGKQVLPMIRPLRDDESVHVSFYAARTMVRLGDPSGMQTLIRVAGMEGSPLRVPAIRELGRHGMMVPAVRKLRTLIDDDSEFVRRAAYDSLVELGDSKVVNRIAIDEQFVLDTVDTERSYTVYATRADEAKLVLFGRRMPIKRPLYYEAPDETVIINARNAGDKLNVFRRVPRTGGYSDTFEVDPDVASLARVLGSRPYPGPDGKIAGLGLTYSQVVSVLYAMCQREDIPARFVLQEQPEVRKIYENITSAGRPDTPE